MFTFWALPGAFFSSPMGVALPGLPSGLKPPFETTFLTSLASQV